MHQVQFRERQFFSVIFYFHNYLLKQQGKGTKKGDVSPLIGITGSNRWIVRHL